MFRITEEDKQLSEAISNVTEKGMPDQIVLIYPDGEKFTFNSPISNKFRRYILMGFTEECQKRDEEEK